MIEKILMTVEIPVNEDGFVDVAPFMIMSKEDFIKSINTLNESPPGFEFIHKYPVTMKKENHMKDKARLWFLVYIVVLILITFWLILMFALDPPSTVNNTVNVVTAIP